MTNSPVTMRVRNVESNYTKGGSSGVWNGERECNQCLYNLNTDLHVKLKATSGSIPTSSAIHLMEELYFREVVREIFIS